MAATFPLTPPTVGGLQAVANLRLQRQVGQTMSPTAGPGPTQEWDGAWWAAELITIPMRRIQANSWNSFIVSLRGKSGYFLIGDPASNEPLGNMTGSPVVDGAGQTGDAISIRNAPISLTDALLPGDYIQVETTAGPRLHMVSYQGAVNTDGTGRADIPIEPGLRDSPADGSAITYIDPVGMFQLATNDIGWDISTALRYSYTIPIIEKMVKETP